MIRKLIREMLLQERNLKDIVGAVTPPVSNKEEIYNLPKSAASNTYAWARGVKSTLPYRREIKRLWNQHADHSFFDDPKNLYVWHEIGLYAKDDIVKYFEGYNAGDKIPGVHFPNKNEISCAAKLKSKNPPGPSRAYFTFKKYRMTFASAEDLMSEKTSSASPDDKSYYAASGLPKRPEAMTPLQYSPLDEEEVIKLTRFLPVLQEVIIDNWIIDAYHGLEENRAFIESLGLKFIPHNVSATWDPEAMGI